MSWRIRQQYGFGAANVELAAEPHFVAHRSLSIGGALVDAGRDFYLSTLPPLLLAAFMIIALFVTVSKDQGYTDLEVVMISDVVELAEETPEPEPIAIEPEPIPVEPEPEPPPPVQKIVEKKPEPPPPVQKIAEVKPKPVPRVRPKPKPVPRAKPKPPPVKPRMEAIAMQAPKPAPPPPVRRGNRVREVAKPKMELAPLTNAPKLAVERPDSSTRRFAAVRAEAPSRRPKADLGPPIAARALSAPAPEAAPTRTRRAAPRNESEKRAMAKVSFAGSAAPVPAAQAKAPTRARTSRPVAEPSRSRNAPPPMALAAAAPGAPQAASLAGPRRTERARTERNETTRSRSDHTAGKGLAGVPLASLATCVSEREEEALKRKLVAAVTTQTECVSRAGTYRFVETKNLNAFLMTIERSANRPLADRCVELEYALACVSR